MTYTAERVRTVLLSVYDPAFYDRGGLHAPERKGEDDPGRSTGSNPHSTMDALCEVIDVRNALVAAPIWAMVILRDYAVNPMGEMRSLHGPNWGEKLHLACQEVAKILNGQ